MRRLKIILGILTAAGMASAKGLLLLPIAGEMESATDAKTVNRLFRDALEARYPGTLMPVPDLPEPCGERECALKAARAAGADEVIYSSLSRLGSRWIFNSTRIGAEGGDAFSQRLTALSIEDFENVTLRMADALLNRKTAEQVASVDNIVQKEEKEPERRRSLSSTGVSLGYLYPVDKKNFNDNGAVIRLAFVNNWELRNDLLLNGEIVWGATDVSIGADLNLDYVFSRTDYSPFLGGGLGLHYINSASLSDSARHSGPALNVQGGLLLFRTYDVHVMLRGQYQVVFNDDVAQGISINAGFTFRQFGF